jgi:hypothetical protein
MQAARKRRQLIAGKQKKNSLQTYESQVHEVLATKNPI